MARLYADIYIKYILVKSAVQGNSCFCMKLAKFATKLFDIKCEYGIIEV